MSLAISVLRLSEEGAAIVLGFLILAGVAAVGLLLILVAGRRRKP